MGGLIIVVLAILWLLGFIQIPGLAIGDFTLFVVNGQRITLLQLLIFIVVLWAIETLPSPIREITAIILLLWVFSILGVIVISGLPNILVIAILIGLFISLFTRKHS